MPRITQETIKYAQVLLNTKKSQSFYNRPGGRLFVMLNSNCTPQIETMERLYKLQPKCSLLHFLQCSRFRSI